MQKFKKVEWAKHKIWSNQPKPGKNLAQFKSLGDKIISNIKKNLMKHFWNLLKNVDFYAQNELKRRPGDELGFFSKIRFCHFSYFIDV